MSDPQIQEPVYSPSAMKSDAFREKLRTKARESTFFMGKAVIGFKDLDPDVHGMMARWIQRESKRKLGLAPRDHLKTSVWTIADTVRLFTANPNTRILIVNETASNARNFLARIRAVVERSEVYRWLFPEIIPDFDRVRWTQDQIEVNRSFDYPEATVEVIGVGGASTSRHYNRIKEDDLVGKEASESPLVMQKAIDQHKLAESLLNCPDDIIDTYGTRWGPNDLTEWMYTNEPDIDHLRLEVIRPDGTPLWPARFTLRELERLKQKYGPAMFALQYENRCLGEGITDFREEWLQFFTSEQLDDDILFRIPSRGGAYRTKLSQTERYTFVDPCFSPDSGDARSAIVTVALTGNEPFDILILSAIAKKCTPAETIKIAYEEGIRWGSVSINIECVAGQVAFFYWACEKYPDGPFRQLKVEHGRKKESRIRQVGHFFENLRVFGSRGQVDFITEFINFPNGQTVDLLDAFAYGPQVWAPPPPDSPDDFYDDYDQPSNAKVGLDGRSRITGY